jgi:SAM-dependent methyltransferase
LKDGSLTPYRLFAQCYDHMMRAVDYSGWAEAIGGFFRDFGIPRGAVLDAGCGTGTLAIRLGRLGYRVIGLDRSPEMLARARCKARSIPSPRRPKFVEGGLESFRVPSRVSAVLCLHDSINYLLQPKAVAAFFSRAAEALRPGGLLVFDAGTRHNIAVNFAGQTFCENYADYSFIWRNRFNRLSALARVELDFLIRDAGGRCCFGRERHCQRIYRMRTLARLLAADGRFLILGRYDGWRHRPAHGASEGVTFVARRL